LNKNSIIIIKVLKLITYLNKNRIRIKQFCRSIQKFNQI